MSFSRLLLLLPAAALVHGCVFVPIRSAAEYDVHKGCHVERMQLGLEVLPGYEQCSGEGCVAMVAIMGITALSSAVVSGSIVWYVNTLRRSCTQNRDRILPAALHHDR